MNYGKALSLGSALSVLAAAASAAGLDYNLTQRRQDDTNQYLGVTGSIYFPTQQRFKDAFRSEILYYGFTVAQNNLDYNWKVRPDIGLFVANDSGNRLFVLPVMAAISRKFATPGSNFQPYAKLGAGVAYFDYRIDEPDGLGGKVRTKGSKFGTAATAELGLILGQRIRVFGAYNYFSKQKGFDFSGFQIGATVSIFKL